MRPDAFKPYVPEPQSLRRGADFETTHIRYADNVSPEEQIPGLCAFLEREYERILGTAQKVFGELPDDSVYRRVPVILSKKKPSKTYRNKDPYVIRKIKEQVDRAGTISEKEIADILKITADLTGCFFGRKEPYIELYYTRIRTGDRDAYCAQIANVLAHEFTHSLEDAYRGGCGEKSRGEACVSEALADFFGLLYSLKRSETDGLYDRTVAKDRYLLWQDRFGSAWPYAYALCFYRVNGQTLPYSERFDDYISNGCVEKLRSVFRETPAPRSALERLNG